MQRGGNASNVNLGTIFSLILTVRYEFSTWAICLSSP